MFHLDPQFRNNIELLEKKKREEKKTHHIDTSQWPTNSNGGRLIEARFPIKQVSINAYLFVTPLARVTSNPISRNIKLCIKRIHSRATSEEFLC